MRTLITDHIANPVNDKIEIAVTDASGAGGAHHRYVITGADFERNPAFDDSDLPMPRTTILFQNGPIAEAGVNGVTQEVLLAIVIDRLRCFQAGAFACPENEEALRFATGALDALKRRTLERMQRGVEGRSIL